MDPEQKGFAESVPVAVLGLHTLLVQFKEQTLISVPMPKQQATGAAANQKDHTYHTSICSFPK